MKATRTKNQICYQSDYAKTRLSRITARSEEAKEHLKKAEVFKNTSLNKHVPTKRLIMPLNLPAINNLKQSRKEK